MGSYEIKSLYNLIGIRYEHDISGEEQLKKKFRKEGGGKVYIFSLIILLHLTRHRKEIRRRIQEV